MAIIDGLKEDVNKQKKKADASSAQDTIVGDLNDKIDILERKCQEKVKEVLDKAFEIENCKGKLLDAEEDLEMWRERCRTMEDSMR